LYRRNVSYRTVYVYRKKETRDGRNDGKKDRKMKKVRKEKTEDKRKEERNQELLKGK